MGESETYTIEQNTGYMNLSYQFIVDFSQSGGFSSGDSLKMTLETTSKDVHSPEYVPEVKNFVTVAMVDSTFNFRKTTTDNSLTQSFTCSFSKGADASKWENRASALILTPKDSSDLPPDARIKAVTDNRTIDLYKNAKSFIVPLSLLQNGTKKVELTLQSALFPKGGGSYEFTAQWLISPSKAGKAPVVGYSAGTLDVTFTSPERKVPSLKLTGQSRVLTNKDTLKLTVEMKNLN